MQEHEEKEVEKSKVILHRFSGGFYPFDNIYYRKNKYYVSYSTNAVYIHFIN